MTPTDWDHVSEGPWSRRRKHQSLSREQKESSFRQNAQPAILKLKFLSSRMGRARLFARTVSKITSGSKLGFSRGKGQRRGVQAHLTGIVMVQRGCECPKGASQWLKPIG